MSTFPDSCISSKIMPLMLMNWLLIDGVLYVSETHIRSIAPLEEPRLMETGLLIFLYGQEASMKNSAFRAMTGNGMFS